MSVLCDLDGVIYRGQTPLPGVKPALERLREEGVAIFFITNNSTLSPQAAADKITRVTGFEADAAQVLTSCLAAVSLLGPDDGPVLMVGEEGVVDAVARTGLPTTEDAMEARSVLVGLTRSLTYELLGRAMRAIRNGARFIATNDDTTFPTEDGLLPGCGAIVAAIAVSSGVAPIVAGKPNQPMRDLIRSRGVTDAWVIGDRADTDIVLAQREPGWRSVLVLTGVSDEDGSETAGADHVVADFPAAVDLVLAGLDES